MTEKLNFVYKSRELLSLNNNIGWASIVSAGTGIEENLLFKSEQALLEVAEQRHVVVALDNEGKFVGFIALWDISDRKRGVECSEVGTVYVPDNFRGKGFGQSILGFSLRLWNGSNGLVICTSKNIRFIHMALKAGMVAVLPTKDMLDIIPLTCVCAKADGVPESNRCPFIGRDCVFLISSSSLDQLNLDIRNDRIVLEARDFSQ